MSSVPELVAKKKRVLIVDDSSTVRVVLRRWLHASGFETVECSSGEQALRVLSGSTFDMITMDVDMPGMNGFEACEQLRAEEAVKKKTPIPVIFVTSHDTFADRKRGYDCGAADFLPKPPQESDFLARVNRLLKPQDRKSVV